MTDFSPVRTHAELQPGSNAPFATSIQPSVNGLFPPQHGDLDEEEIKCVCGYNEDDGNTVYCEICRTWQHIECYYPDVKVPEVHECVDCHPRAIDVDGAKERQRHARFATSSGERKAKRAPTKTNRKRTKDSMHAPGQTNGWPMSDHNYATDRTSGSPRDQPPPAKRPKTNHRNSSSLSAMSRKRAGSAMAAHSPTKSLHSPPARVYPGEYFSQEFMDLHQRPEFTPIHTNCYTISVSNDLDSWLTETGRVLEVTGTPQHEIFNRWDRAIEELESTSPGVTRHSYEDVSITIRGRHPIFQRITLDGPVSVNAYIGEIKGHVGRKEQYQQESANRWHELRHPEPFVFFHDKLPIYIDSRVEGTVLRYVRRSCQPNTKIQIIIHGREFHFCLISTKDIDAGEEITLGWSLDEQINEIVKKMAANRGTIDEENEAHMEDWMSGVLANLGGCACGRPQGSCLFSRFDTRVHPNSAATNGQGLKPPKARKLRKTVAQISPLSTGRATNSRAGSEAVNTNDPDDENTDARSASASSRSKPTSRDITPMAGITDAGACFGVEMSDRERRKLQQQERLFEQLEQAEQHGGRKKKRNSAGSTLNTPSASTSKQLGYDSTLHSPITSGSAVRSRANGQTPKPNRPHLNGASQTPRRTKPVYVNSSAQTDQDDSESKSPTPLTVLRRTQGTSYLQVIQRRIQEQRARYELRRNQLSYLSPASQDSTTAMPPPPLPSSDTHRVDLPTTTSSSPRPKTEGQEDTEMNDAAAAPLTGSDISASTVPDAPLPASIGLSQHPHSPSQPHAPPWLPAAGPLPPATSPSKAHNLRVELPPAPVFSDQSQTPTTPSGSAMPTSASSITVNPMIQSPLSAAGSIIGNGSTPIFPPSLASIVTPSPQKKKLSLSDYTNRRKKNEALQQAQQAQQQQNSGSSAPSQASSLANVVASSREEKDKPPRQQQSSITVEEADILLPHSGLVAANSNNVVASSGRIEAAAADAKDETDPLTAASTS